MQEWNLKGQNSAEVTSTEECEGQQEGFYRYMAAKKKFKGTVWQPNDEEHGKC